jgi:hypothetical protein
MEIQRYVISALLLSFFYLFCSENLAAQKAQNRSRINLELHKQIIDEVKIGLWTVEQAQEKIKAIENDGSPRPAKRCKKVVREFSPDWEDITSGSEDS